MNQELMKEFKADLKEFREMTEKFYAKEVSVKDYKGFSGGFGSYAQKGGEASMLRLRMPGGRVTKEKLKFLVDSIERYDVKRAHITTCQTVQFHDLDAKAVCDIMEQAMDAGIVTRGGGGDFPRNTMVSPLSGVEEGTEKVDNTVYIWYNVSIKYRRCFYDRTTAEIGAKSIHGNI